MIRDMLAKYIRENDKDYKNIPIVITTIDDISYAPSFFNDENEKFLSFFLKTNDGNYFKIIPKEDIRIIEVVYSNDGKLVEGDQILEIIFDDKPNDEDTSKMYG